MSKENINGWWLVVVFGLLAGSFLIDFWGEEIDVVAHKPVAVKYFTKSPVREARFEPITHIDGYMQRCNDCHQSIEPSKVQKSQFSAHPDVILDHGVNNYCTTCHSPSNRDKLLDINKNEVSFAESQKSCLQCHGPIYRDWENGVHGRMNDFWSKEKGVVRKLSCVSCHDPHQPAFKSMKPSPAPQLQNYKRFLEDLSIESDSHG